MDGLSRQSAEIGAGTADLSEHLSWTYAPTAGLQAHLSPGPLLGIFGLFKQSSEAVTSPADLPEHVIMAMLRRETLLMHAKLMPSVMTRSRGRAS